MKNKDINLGKLSEEDLLSLRIRDLPLAIENCWLNNCLNKLYRELEAKGIKFKPPCYLADEWLAPDGEPLVGIPFFLAHPALIKLERKMMLDVEGGTRFWCLKLLRHEAGHAINYAYKLYRKRKWQKIFGKFSKEYAQTYRFRPYSKNFVRHLENYYAQYHPDEDFAETFAVWLAPNFNWQKHYKGWRAILKLNYLNQLMEEIKGKEPQVTKGMKYWQASKISMTLGNYYKKKRYSYAEHFPDFHDSNLKKIFILDDQADKKSKDTIIAAQILKHYKKDILNSVAKWTGERKYIIGDILDTIIGRCKALKLVTAESEPSVILKIATYITTLTMNYLYTGGLKKDEKTKSSFAF